MNLPIRAFASFSLNGTTACFQENNKGRAKSTVSVVLHVNNPDQNRLQSIKANLNVTWMSDSQQNPVPNLIQVTDLELLERDASAAFEPLLTLKPSGSPSDSSMMNPILVYDLDRKRAVPTSSSVGLNRVFLQHGRRRVSTGADSPRATSHPQHRDPGGFQWRFTSGSNCR